MCLYGRWAGGGEVEKEDRQSIHAQGQENVTGTETAALYQQGARHCNARLSETQIQMDTPGARCKCSEDEVKSQAGRARRVEKVVN